MRQGIHNVFISHVHEDDDGLAKLKSLLAKKRYEIRDSSIHAGKENNANSPDYIKSKILAPAINWAGVLVVYVSPMTHKSKWVNWEIEHATKMGKRVVGVWAHGARESDLPGALDLYGDAIVGWNSDRVIDAIAGRSNHWRGPAGDERPPRQITRYHCY